MEEEELLLEAQKRLEGKRASLMQMDLKPIGLAVEEIAAAAAMPALAETVGKKSNLNCGVCGVDVDSGSFCAACWEKKEAAYQENLAAEMAAEEKIRQGKKIHNFLKQSCIGDRFKGMSFSDYIPENAAAKAVLDACVEFVENFHQASGKNLLLIGSPGTGKNMLAAIICQELINRGHPCLHTTAMRCVRRIKDSWRDKGESEQGIIDSFAYPDLLVIDEVGVQFGSPTEQLYLTEIINDRYERRKPTILISNLTLKQLEEVMGTRIIDRFYEGGSRFLVFNWPSYRRKK